MEPKKKKVSLFKKFMKGLCYFVAGIFFGSRLEVFLQNRGVLPTTCQYVTLCEQAEPELEQVQTKKVK